MDSGIDKRAAQQGIGATVLPRHLRDDPFRLGGAAQIFGDEVNGTPGESYASPGREIATAPPGFGALSGTEVTDFLSSDHIDTEGEPVGSCLSVIPELLGRATRFCLL